MSSIRLNTRFDETEWVFALSAAGQLAFIKLQCHVKNAGCGGRCKALSPAIAARKFGIGREHWVKFLKSASDSGWLVVEAEDWILPSWQTDQGAEDKVAKYARVVKCRLRRKDANDASASPRINARIGEMRNDTAASIFRPSIGTRDSGEIYREKENPPNGGQKKRRPDSLDEVKAYFAHLGMSDDQAEAFHDFYETNDWVQGSSAKAIKDWHGAARTWKRMRKRFGELEPESHEAILEELARRRQCGQA